MWHSMRSLSRVSSSRPACSRAVPGVRAWAGAASLTACAWLAACATTPPPPVDTTAPAVTSHTPADGDDNVSVHAPITVQFSEPLAPTSVTDTSVQLAGTGSIAIAKTLDLSDDGLLTITPVGSLALPQDLTLGLGGGITDAAGNVLDPLAYAWTVPSWLRLGDDPVMQYDSDSRSYRPLLAVDGAGTLVVAGYQEEYPQARLRRWNGDTWHEVPLPPTSGVVFEISDIVFDDLDRLVMVWRHVTASSMDFHVGRLDGTTWTPLGDGLLVGSTAYPEVAAIAIGADGEPVVAWSEDSANTDQYVKRWNGSTWVQLGSKLDVSDGNLVQQIDVAISLGGAPIVSWVDRSTDATEVRAFDATTSSWGSVGTSPFVDALPQLLVPVGGGLLAAAETAEGITVYTFNGTKWVQRGAPALRTTGARTGNPSVRLTAVGTVVAAWTEYEDVDDRSALNVAELTDEGWVYLGESIDVAAGFGLTEPSLVLLADDLPAVVVNASEPFPGSVMARRPTLFRQLNR